MPRVLRRERPPSPEDTLYWPPPFSRPDPQPERRRMPPKWKPEPFDYLVVNEDFYVGSRFFGKGGVVRRDDPLANKLVYECPQWVHVVRLNKED